MDAPEFDKLARAFGSPSTRRHAVKGMLAAAAGLLGIRTLSSEAVVKPTLTVHNAT